MDISSTVSWVFLCALVFFAFIRRTRFDRKTGQYVSYHNGWLYILIGMAIMAFLLTFLSQENPMFLVRLLQR